MRTAASSIALAIFGWSIVGGFYLALAVFGLSLAGWAVLVVLGFVIKSENLQTAMTFLGLVNFIVPLPGYVFKLLGPVADRCFQWRLWILAQDDPRPPVLLLRSFHAGVSRTPDSHQTYDGPSSGIRHGGPMRGQSMASPGVHHIVSLAPFLRPYGLPVVVDPGNEKAPYSGEDFHDRSTKWRQRFATESEPDLRLRSPHILTVVSRSDDWLETIRVLASSSRCIFVIPGTSEGVKAELALIVERDELRSKTLVVMPPETWSNTLASSWEDTRQHLSTLGWKLPPYDRNGSVYLPDRLLSEMESEQLDPWGVDEAVRRLLSRSPAPVTGVPLAVLAREWKWDRSRKVVLDGNSRSPAGP
ncbi:hypothetical protein JY651_27755 [Pyxidicoccus parkwayensis]|uniref:Uncharacterized protein n=1 Tax=Pyxidicoccus parkwayensis TaxID=2813578 RepID=A0ABX7NP09_9BACT|nr:hypothetical protein [Pyxidicoccus parkwaysis]QSQ19141.1 hypothetical protein JY651_27755 [Pyxidicoccus parkwaysis]